MDGPRRVIRTIAVALAAPFVVILMVLLAIVAGLAYYVMAFLQGLWLLFRDLPASILSRKKKPPLPKPHFVNLPARGEPVE